MLTKQPWILPGDDITCEYLECRDEGRDVEEYEAAVKAVEAIQDSEERNRLAKALFDEMESRPIRADFPFAEPETLEGILAECPDFTFNKKRVLSDAELSDKVRGAWHGRIIGCLLGKPIEGIRRKQLNILMEETGNNPPRDYFYGNKMNYEDLNAKFGESVYKVGPNRPWADTVTDASPIDDDTTYCVHVLETLKCLPDATPAQLADGILHNMPFYYCCTAERVAYRNSAAGLLPPETAKHYNPYRELLGARLRADVFGFTRMGDPAGAARAAYHDGTWSHVKNGVYTEMYTAAMIAAAPYCDTAEEILEAGLAQIPKNCRLSAAIREVQAMVADGKSPKEIADVVHARFDENHIYGWCHTISNDMLIASALLAGRLDFTESMAQVEAYAFDTDSNGATLGAIVGACIGEKAIPAYWKAPYHGRQKTALMSRPLADVDYLEKTTMDLIKRYRG